MKRKLTHAQVSAKGGSAGRGSAKARSSDAARAAVLQRWKNHLAKTGKPNVKVSHAQTDSRKPQP